MNKTDSKNSNTIWLFSFVIVWLTNFFIEHYDYNLENKYHLLIWMDLIEIIVAVVFITIPVTFDFYKTKVNNLTVKKYYFELDDESDTVRLLLILELLISVYELLQDMYHLRLINRITEYNSLGISLILLVLYLKYLALKTKRTRWNYLDNSTESISWKHLIQNNYFDQYKGEIILSKLLRILNLENVKVKISANNYFDYYKEFVEKLQFLSNQELIELYNYLNMKSRDSYNWSIRKIMSANLGKVCLSIFISLLSFSSIISIIQLCSSIKKEVVLNGMISLLNYFILFYVLLFLFFYLVKIVIYSVFIPYQRKIRNKNIEAFLLSTLRSVLDIRLNKKH